MIILIGGSTHTGKTALSQKLIEKYHYPSMSLDHLKMGMIRSGIINLTPDDDDKMTGLLWPIVKEILDLFRLSSKSTSHYKYNATDKLFIFGESIRG